MKIVIHYSGGNEYQQSLNKLLKILNKDEVFIYNFKEKDPYYYSVKHYNFYKKVFDLCEEKEVDLLLLILDELVDCDILLNELRRRKTKVIFRFTEREIRRSKARKDSFIRLFNHENTHSAIIIPMIDKGLEINHPKVKIAFSNSLEKEVKKLNILYFGRIKEAKGIDILLESIKYLPSSVDVKIAGEPDSDYDINKLKGYNVDLGFINDKKMEEYFKGTDIVVLPYKKGYMYGHSSLLLQACQYRKPVILPDFPPFNYIVKKYKIGKLFDPENPLDLAKKIEEFVENDYLKYLKKRDFFDLIKEELDGFKKRN